MKILTKIPGRTQNQVAWLIAIATLSLLGILRHTTNAEYAFASASIIPVFLVAWTGGFNQGISVSLLAILMWVGADALSEQSFRESWIPLLNGLVRLTTYCFIVYLTAKVQRLLAREVEISTHDPLTNLLNRRAFLEKGKAETSRAQRYAHPIAVVFLDLDKFKTLNDTRGHDVGDAALVAVAKALQGALRETDIVARLGGDEFALILLEIDQASASSACHSIAAAIVAALVKFPPVSVSLGVAWFEKAEGDFSVLLKAADTLMYESKEEGKGRIRMRAFGALPANDVVVV